VLSVVYLESLSLSHPLYSLLPPSIINVHHSRLGSTVPFIATLAHGTHYCAMLIFEMLLAAGRLFIRSLKVKQYYVCLELPCGIMATVCWTY